MPGSRFRCPRCLDPHPCGRRGLAGSLGLAAFDADARATIGADLRRNGDQLAGDPHAANSFSMRSAWLVEKTRMTA